MPWPALAFALLLAVQPLLVSLLRGFDTAWVVPPARREVQPTPRLARALSVGHVATLVDWLWMRAMIDPAIHHVASGDHPPTFHDLDLATRLDPAFFELYSAGASFLVVVRDDKLGAKLLLERGEAFRSKELPLYSEAFQKRFWRDAWRVPMTLGYVHLFELGDLQAASTAFTEAGGIPGAPAFLTKLAARFAAPGGAFEVGGRLLTQMIESERDPRARAALEQRRKSLFLSQYLQDLNSQFRAFLSKDSKYRSSVGISSEEMAKYWERFRKSGRVPPTDPWGGKIQIDRAGQVTSTTPRIKVFGLE